MKLVRVFALLSLGAVGMAFLGSGCSLAPNCPPDTKYIVDNRDRKNPSFDQDWLCFSIPIDAPPEDTPPVIPDVSRVSPPDSAGPKDPDGVVKAAIAHQSCFA